MEQIFRIFDFNVYNKKITNESDEDSSVEVNTYKDEQTFLIQMFGLNEFGKTCSILVEHFKPFFYVLVDDHWDIPIKNKFLQHIKTKIGKFYENSIEECIIVKRKKLYGFDGGKEYKFLKLSFENMNAFNKTKNIWYGDYVEGRRILLKDGYIFNNTKTELYEANIPPLLRFFHIRDISPSGWIAIPNTKIKETSIKQTTCDYEFSVNFKHIVPLNDKETRVPYKICSFDIEASSSHGDFPVPIKSYKKLATNIVEYFEGLNMEITSELCKNILRRILLAAFGYEKMSEIDIVYPKSNNVIHSKRDVEELTEKWLQMTIQSIHKKAGQGEHLNFTKIENLFQSMNIKKQDDHEETNESFHTNYHKKSYSNKNATIVDILCDKKFDRESKLIEINHLFNTIFPRLEGDKVTFIGSTFMNYGEKEPYMNHCIVLNTCSSLDSVVKNSVIESYQTESKVLLAWRDLIQRENPDIIIGYNIFGFDYEFMFRRAEETGCVEEFLQLSRNKGEICGNKIKDEMGRETNKYQIEESSIQIASGQHDLHFIKMNGRLQVDLYNFFRREENLTSYKLDYVAGHFIGDYIKQLDDTGVNIKSGNLIGLQVGSYVHFEEIGHSVDYYENGAKFKVLNMDATKGEFTIDKKIKMDPIKKIRWCLAKDDVTPKDIFRMTNGTAEDRSVIAKYCIQDCNLVHNLMNKVDVLTGFIEMAKICSVPINFLVMRGQGIKLTSYIAKKCREKQTLMPVIEKGNKDDGYEGAIVLDPKCDLYLDNPVACVDYASLYPSSMISENLSHDSKVWTKEYDLSGNLICEIGVKDSRGQFKYDDLTGYEYVNVTYDTYKYIRKTPSSSAEKVKCGKKICRFAQFPEGKKAIMPSILEELLMARKSTRKMIPLQTDDFMKNVLDKRQLGYKVTANSLYGQCGATTSTFYEQDVAASTTATGRLLLTYAKKMIEETYGDAICHSEKYGPILTKAEYIYGDSVASYSPVFVKYKNIVDVCTIEELSIKYGKDEWVASEEKEFCELNNIETWTENGWTPLYRVIRHALAPTKKMIRIVTHHGVVDVTDDHSLLTTDGLHISPKNTTLGMELLHHKMNSFDSQTVILINKHYKNIKSYIYHEFYMSPLEDDKDLEMIIRDQLEAAYLFLAASENGLFCYVTEKNGKYHVTVSKHESTLKINEITKIKTIPYQGYVYDLTTQNHHFASGIGNIIVHNTDSVFFTFNLHTMEGKPIRGKDALEITIELAQEAGHLASKFLKSPHDLEYEKTFMPFCLLSKKRYVGMLYEHDPEKCKRKEMGIVLKRRDNAPIVKDIYGGIIDILMKKQNIEEAIDFLKTSLQHILDEKYTMDKLIITKSLRSGYKNPKSIAHKVLADRITLRDPGNKPSSGDRIPFVYIHNNDKKALQGDKIETPTYIKEQNLKIDYSFYITNQIMKPVQQVFALVLEKIWEMNDKKKLISKFRKEVEKLRLTTPPDKFEDKLEQLKNKEVKAMLFDSYLRETNNEKSGNQNISNFFIVQK